MSGNSLFDVMSKNKSDKRLSMGYESADYLDIMKYLKNINNIINVVSGNGSLAGSYIPGLNELVDSGFDTNDIKFNDKGFSIGDDESKKLASLSFRPRRGFVAIKKSEDLYGMIKMAASNDNRVVCGHSSCGQYVSPPTTLKTEIIEKTKTNSENGSYRVGVTIDGTGMLKDYFIHFYPNEGIGIGLKNGSIGTDKLEKLISERCLYAEVSFGGLSKTAFFSVTDSHRSGSVNELYIHFDAPLCVTSALSGVFNIGLDTQKWEPVNTASKYDFKKGMMENCNSTKYSEYASKNSKESPVCNISLSKKSLLGVRFFCLPEKKSSVESVVGVMPDDFYETNVNFSEDMSAAVTYSGIDFVSGEVMEARRTFCENRGSLPEEIANKLRSAYAQFKSHSGDPYFTYQFRSDYNDFVLGQNCGYFIIPEGYPIGLASSRLQNQIVKDLTTRPESSYTDPRLINNSDNGVSLELQRGYSDDIYLDLVDKAKGQIAIKCNKFIAPLLTEFFQAILNYYGGANIPKIAPSLCALSSCVRLSSQGPCHKRGTAIDIDYKNNFQGRNQFIKDGENTNFKGFLEIVRASGCRWPITVTYKSGGTFLDYMHFQWK